MYLVYEKKNQPGKWAISWMWLPHFLAADRELHKLVDKTMTEEFRGTVVDSDPQRTALVEKLNNRIVGLILEKYPIRGLRHLLDTYIGLEPEEKFDELQ